MGRVFSYDEISNARVPHRNDFVRATEVFKEEVDQAVEQGLIEGAFIYGSVAIGAANRRSDLDALIALPARDEACQLASRRVIRKVRKATHEKVEVNAATRTHQALEEGRHDFDRFFGQHLSSKFRIIIGEDPSGYMQFADRPAGSILADYLTHKKRTLDTALAAPFSLEAGSETLHGVQRMLELPQAVGRKALQAVAETVASEQPVVKSADKAAIAEQASRLMKSLGLDEGFKNLMTYDKLYSHALKRVISGDSDADDYRKKLKILHDRLPEAIIWLDEVELALLPKLPGGTLTN